MGYDTNCVVIIGRLTRDPEQRMAGDKNICNFSVACGDGKDKTNFFDITAWDKTAMFVGQYLKKGSQVAISGKLKHDTWTDKTSGQNRSKISITALNVQSVGGKSDRPAGDNQELSGDAVVGNFPTGSHDAPEDCPF